MTAAQDLPPANPAQAPPTRPATTGGWGISRSLGVRLAITLVAMLAAGGSVAALRLHGINSCRDRGGRPIAPSIFARDSWDVSCIPR